MRWRRADCIMERLPSANKENDVFSEQAADSSRLSGKGNAAAQYRRYLGRKRLAVALAGAAVLLAFLLSLAAGSSDLGAGEFFAALLGRGTRQTNAVLWNVRAPRTFAAVAVGAALALSGCVMQNVLRNPLASASTLGVSQGASFGAAVAIDLLAVRCSASAVANSAIRMQQDEGKMIGVIYAGLGISSTLKASGVESEYINRVEGHYAKTIRMEQRLGRLQGVLGAVSPVTSQLASVLVLLFGCVEILRGQMTVGMLVAFTGLLGGFTSPVEQLAGFTRRIQEMKSSMGQVQDIMEYGQDEVYEEGEQRAMTEKLSGQVELREVAFGYSRLAPPLIQDFSFTLPCGSSIALVGASGCGKSTVSKLISGLYLPWQGQVLFDGVPSQEIPRDVKFASIATVSQDIRLFSGTIRDNLTLWNQSVLEEDIIRAAKDACVHDIITKKPGAYEYLLSEGGKNLSGGQRQRLEIARALASNPTILVLDEATSALDPETEKEILDNIKRRGCTCVMVAHRLSAIRVCDEILVMEEGKIVQRGNHQSLMAQEGHYQRLVRSSEDS